MGRGWSALGVDTFATARGEDGEWRTAPDGPFEGLVLADGRGTSSIRGDRYAEVVAAATGESLYQERIEPATVARMAERLRAAVEEAKLAGSRSGEAWIRGLDAKGDPRIYRLEFPILEVAGCEISGQGAEDLARWFEICAEHGYAIEGRW